MHCINMGVVGQGEVESRVVSYVLILTTILFSGFD